MVLYILGKFHIHQVNCIFLFHLSKQIYEYIRTGLTLYLEDMASINLLRSLSLFLSNWHSDTVFLQAFCREDRTNNYHQTIELSLIHIINLFRKNLYYYWVLNLVGSLCSFLIHQIFS